MSKQGKIYIILTIIAILALIVFEYTKPQKVNWYPSYAKQHKIPFGTFIFNEQLERLFLKENIINIERPSYEYLNNNSSIEGTYIFINDQVEFDNAELESLLEWTSNGNTLIIASENINKKLLDTIHAKNSVISNFNNIDNIYNLKLKNSAFKKDQNYVFDKADFLNYFNKIDTLKTVVIGVVHNYTECDLKEHANVIIHPFGTGTIILSTFPQAFTNYFILSPENQNYTAGLLSYIDSSKPIYLDNYYKSGKAFYSSPMYVLLNNKALKWAYYIMLIGVLIYVIFEGKRKQRAIPIVHPLKNQTIDFTRTIANMYYENHKHSDIANHKIQYFLDFIRTHLHLNTNTVDDAFINNLAVRSNNTVDDTKYLFNFIESITNKTTINIIELEQLNTLIETFKSKNKWTTKN